MAEIRNLKSLKEDLLWEVEVNASISELTNKLIMPNDIRQISSLILEQLINVTECKYCFAGNLDPDSNKIVYIIKTADDNDKIHVYSKKLTIEDHPGVINKIIKKCKPLLENSVKEKNGLLMKPLAPSLVERYILAPAIFDGIMVGLIGIFNAPKNYTERDLMFVKRLANFYALAIERFRLDQMVKKANRNLEEKIKKRTKELAESNILLKNEINLKKIIEKKLIEAKLKAETANKAKSSFVANMSHELRTPLNHIIGFTNLVLDKDVGDLNETQEDYLNDVRKSSEHLLSLINDILDLSKVEAGKFEFKPSQIDIKELLENSLTMIKEKAFKHKIKLDIKLESIPDTIFADERSLKQVMYNLLSNAVKFTQDNGTVSILARMSDQSVETNQTVNGSNGQYLMVSITDSGIGISPDNLSCIFNPFEQVQNSLDKNYAGTGLGLSLSRNLIKMHKGKIWAESKGEGHGTTFHFIIPEST